MILQRVLSINCALMSETDEADITFNWFALPLKSVHRRLFVSIANGDAAEENVGLIRNANKFLDKLCMHGEEFLGTGVQPFLTQQSHDRLTPHPDIRPLRRPHAAVKIAQQHRRGIE